MSSTLIRTPDQRLRVFISSTMKELAAERTAAGEAVNRLRLRPILFEAGARPHPPRDLYKAYLEQSDVFIGIYGAEYGWIGPGMEISGLEDEYLLAADKPRLIYIKGDTDERDNRLKEMLARITDRGEVSYRRFSTPEELADLIENDLALLLTEQFQAATARPATGRQGGRPSTLPALTSRLIGREQEVANIETLLRRPEVRLVTLSGPGGVGKTRLALEVAHRVREVFADRVQFVLLAPTREPSLVVPAIAEALGIHEASGLPLIETVKNNLSDWQMLLVIDNFEHVIDAAVHLSELLSASAGLKMLVTSREPLQLYAEYEFPVAPLALPDKRAKDEVLSSTPAIELFLERSLAVRPDLPLNSETLHTAARICEKLDGLPLAIELAAACVRFVPPRTVLERLNEGLDILSRGPRDLPERQRTMRATLAWSYDLLTGQEQKLFQRLSVFSGGCSLGAVEAVVDPNRELGADTLDQLVSLTTKSMLRAVDLQAGQPRFEMLELMREFGAERLAAAGESETIRNRHCRYFAEFAAEHEEDYASSSQIRQRDTAMDYANWREALSWAIDRLSQGEDPPGPVDALLRFLIFYWFMAGRLSEGRQLSEQAVRVSENHGDQQVLASALLAAGAMALWQSHLTEARQRLERSVALWRQTGDRAGLICARPFGHD